MSTSRDTNRFFTQSELVGLALEIISIAQFSPENEVKYWTQDTFDEAYLRFSRKELQVFNFLNKMPSSIAEKSKKLIEIIYESKEESVAIEVPRHLGFAIDRGKLDLAQFAILINSLEGLKWLEEKDKNIAANLPDEMLFFAVARCNVEMLEYLVKEKKLSINVSDEDDQCLLTAAIRTKHLSTIQFVLEQGIDLSGSKERLASICHFALECEKPIIDYLLQSRFVKAYNQLQFSIKLNSLLKHGIDHSNFDLVKECIVESGYKPENILFYAVENLSLPLLQYIIESVDESLLHSENERYSYLNYAITFLNKDTIHQVNAVVKYLLTKGIDPNKPNKFNWVPLSYAVKMYAANVELVNMLINAGAKIDLIDQEGESLITRAANNNATAIVKRLIELKAPLNTFTNSQETAITYSIKNDNEEIFKILIENGEGLYNRAYFALPAEKRYSLLDRAFEAQSKNIFRILLTTPEDITKNNYALLLKSLQKQYTRDLYYFNKLCQAGILKSIPADIIEKVLDYSRSSLKTFKFVEAKLLEQKIDIPYLKIYQDELQGGEKTAISNYIQQVKPTINAEDKKVISRYDVCHDWLFELDELIEVIYDQKDKSHYYFNFDWLEESNPGIFLENTLFRISKEVCLINLKRKDKLQVTDEKLLIDSVILQYTKDQQTRIQNKFHWFESASSDFNRKSSQVITAFKAYQELLAKAEKEVQSSLALPGVNVSKLKEIHDSFSGKISESEKAVKKIEKLFDESKQTLQQYIEKRDTILNGCNPIISEQQLTILFANINNYIQEMQQHYENAQSFLRSFASETDACNLKIDKISLCFNKSKKTSTSNNIQKFTTQNEFKTLQDVNEFQFDLEILQDEQQEIVSTLVVAPAEEKAKEKDLQQEEKNNAEEKTPNKITIVYPGYLKDGIPAYEEKREEKQPSKDEMLNWDNEFKKLQRLSLITAGANLDDWIDLFSKNLNTQQTVDVFQYQIASYILLLKLADFCEELKNADSELFRYIKATQIRNNIWHYKNLDILNVPGIAEFKALLQMCKSLRTYITTASQNPSLVKPCAVSTKFLTKQIKSDLFDKFLKINARKENYTETETKEVVEKLKLILTALESSNLKNKANPTNANRNPKAEAIRYLKSRINAISNESNRKIKSKKDYVAGREAAQDRHNGQSWESQGNPSLLGNFAIRNNINYSNSSIYENENVESESKQSINSINNINASI